MTLYVGKDDYIGMFSPDVGARIAVHPADETPFPEDRGVSAAPGMITSIGTRLVSGNQYQKWLPELVLDLWVAKASIGGMISTTQATTLGICIKPSKTYETIPNTGLWVDDSSEAMIADIGVA